MRDTELYRHLLGLLEPWTVDRVELHVTERRVDVWASHPAGVAWSCPDCAYTGPIRDHAEERTWRHLDSCHFQTFLHARIPRVACPTHRVRQVRVPWAEPDARVIAQVGVDEKAAAKGQTYVTLVCDLERATVEHIAEDRKQASLDGYFTSLSEAQRSSIEAMAMDMWEPYIQSALDQVPEAAQKRGGRAFLDTKLGLHKWMNCSIVTAAMPNERSRSHETVTQEPLVEVEGADRAGSATGRGDPQRVVLTPRRARHPDRHLAQAVA